MPLAPITLLKSNPNLLHDEITTTDHALTQPWVVNKKYQRVRWKEPIWIGKEVYYLSTEELLVPAEKDQSSHRGE